MKNKTLLYWIFIYCILFGFLQWMCRFHFYYTEQLQLFLYTGQYASDTLKQIGGGALYLSRFLVQFFILPFAGPSIVALLLTLTGYFTQGILKKLAPGKDGYFLALLPVLALLIMHWDFNYTLQGTIAYLSMLIAFTLYISIPWNKYRIFAGFIIIPFLYFLAGAIAALLAGSMFIWELWKYKSKGYWAFLYMLEMGFLAFISVRLGLTGAYRFVLLPDAYYDPFLRVGKLYYSWYALFISMLLAVWMKNKTAVSSISRKIIKGLQAAILLFLFYQAWHIYGNRDLQEVKELDYYTRKEQWDKIISTYNDKTANLYTANLLNMALARKGCLGDYMFHHRQQGWETFIMKWNSGIFRAIPLCDIYYHIGDMQTAQKYAFEGYVASLQGGSVRLLKRLVETNLVIGAYPVAEKYIRLLERTLFYKKDAVWYRKFLYNDSLLQQDISLGSKRKSWKKQNSFIYSNKIEDILKRVALSNPEDQTAIQYLAAFYLSTKRLSGFRALIEKYYGTKVWPVLSVSHQEAVIMLSPENPDYWVHYGVSLKVEQHYKAFSQDLREKRNYVNFEKIMAENYGNTYWYYLIFKK